MTRAISATRNHGPTATEYNHSVEHTPNDQPNAQATHRRERTRQQNANDADVTVDRATPNATAARWQRLQQLRSPHRQVRRGEITFVDETPLCVVRTPNGVDLMGCSQAQAFRVRQNMQAFVATFESTPLPPTAEQRIASLPVPEDPAAVRARQRERVLSFGGIAREALQGAAETGTHAAAETGGLFGTAATLAVPLLTGAGHLLSVGHAFEDAEEWYAARAAQGRYERQVESLRAQGRASYEQGRADAMRADFSEGIHPSAIDWERYARDGDYARAVRETIIARLARLQNPDS